MTRITLLTKAHCDLCEHAKEILGRVAADTDIAVDAVDVDTEQGRQLAERAGMAFPPGVLIDGEPFSYGRLSERKLRKTLTKRATHASEASAVSHSGTRGQSGDRR